MLILNIGNDRPNLTMVMCLMRGAAHDLGMLDFVLDQALTGESLKQTVIFFNSQELCLQGFKYLHAQLPEARHHEINYLHLLQTQDAKHNMLEKFQWGKTRILCAMEAAGMVHVIYHLLNHSLKTFQGMDIPNIERIIQFMVPSSLSVLTQWFGRAGRSGQASLTILLVEPTAFHIKKKNAQDTQETTVKLESDENMLKEDDPDEEPVIYRKKIEDGMRHWLDALSCQRAVSNEYFANPPPTLMDSSEILFYFIVPSMTFSLALTFPCCNNCIQSNKSIGETPLTPEESNILSVIKRIESRTKPS